MKGLWEIAKIIKGIVNIGKDFMSEKTCIN